MMFNPESAPRPNNSGAESHESNEQPPKEISLWAREVTLNGSNEPDTWYFYEGETAWEERGGKWVSRLAEAKDKKIAGLAATLASDINNIPQAELTKQGISARYQLNMYPAADIRRREEDMRAENIKGILIRALTEEEAEEFMRLYIEQRKKTN